MRYPKPPAGRRHPNPNPPKETPLPRFALPFLLLGLLLAPAARAEIFPYPTRVETLDNGLKVIVVPMSSGGLVSYWSIVRTGARDEVEPGRTGFAHFFEHMMYRGTEKYPAEVYNGITTKIGADTNAFTSSDLTGYHLAIAAEDLETVIDLESDRFQHLDYPEPMFKTEAGAIYGEFRKNRTNPFFVLLEALYAAAFKEHTYGHLTMGYEEDIKGMPELFDYSRNFFERHYRPENVVVLIAGDVEVEPTLSKVRRYYGTWEPGHTPPEVPVEPPQTAERRLEVSYDGSSLPIVWIGYKGPAFDPADVTQTAARLLCDLAFGETSDIYKQMVLEEQAVEFFTAGLGLSRDPGLLNVYTRVKDPEKVDAVVAEIDRTIERYRAQPPDAGRLADLKSRLKYDFLMGLDTPSHVARSLARTIAVTGGIEAVETLYATYDQVTPEDVRKAAQEILVDTRRTVAVLRGES